MTVVMKKIIFGLLVLTVLFFFGCAGVAKVDHISLCAKGECNFVDKNSQVKEEFISSLFGLMKIN